MCCVYLCVCDRQAVLQRGQTHMQYGRRFRSRQRGSAAYSRAEKMQVFFFLSLSPPPLHRVPPPCVTGLIAALHPLDACFLYGTRALTRGRRALSRVLFILVSSLHHPLSLFSLRSLCCTAPNTQHLHTAQCSTASDVRWAAGEEENARCRWTSLTVLPSPFVFRFPSPSLSLSLFPPFSKRPCFRLLARSAISLSPL